MIGEDGGNSGAQVLETDAFFRRVASTTGNAAGWLASAVAVAACTAASAVSLIS